MVYWAWNDRKQLYTNGNGNGMAREEAWLHYCNRFHYLLMKLWTTRSNFTWKSSRRLIDNREQKENLEFSGAPSLRWNANYQLYHLNLSIKKEQTWVVHAMIANHDHSHLIIVRGLKFLFCINGTLVLTRSPFASMLRFNSEKQLLWKAPVPATLASTFSNLGVTVDPINIKGVLSVSLNWESFF